MKYKAINYLVIGVLVCLSFLKGFSQAQNSWKEQSLLLEKLKNGKHRNIVFILSDDHRYDALGFLKSQTFIQTPNLDKMAKEGAYLPNAMVTTALCSPSRGSILTGLYAHNHKIIDNNNKGVSSDLIFYPQYLQKAGYKTAMIGKWHMGGNSDEPQRGFDFWLSFSGQGSYYPSPKGLNINGKHVPQKGYITDELTDYALNWLKSLKEEQPFMLYLSHKGVHSRFEPAERHKDKFADYEFKPPFTLDSKNHKNAPMWVYNQRNSFHGSEFPYQTDLNLIQYYKQYGETLLAVDESVGRVMEYLKENGLLESTLIIYMGDNGFSFGEHGLIDKRTAYEESMRVPMLAHCPDLIKPGTLVKEVVANIDVASTLLETAGLKAPSYMDGKSFLPLLKGEKIGWRKNILYEYYWERNLPHTPTMFALRGDRYKYIYYYGLWDIEELYDLQQDTRESVNLIASKDHQEIIQNMGKELFSILDETGGLTIQLRPNIGKQMNLRSGSASSTAPFPDYLIKK
ncbi:sulfatase [Pedobacter heparinus]|uniref:sulfatase family protein n=1 Tax=Pedobacter heparinus TaxID=984 RepID=UPI002930F08C|nr:sulfatase [Pedobacter heparinus]